MKKLLLTLVISIGLITSLYPVSGNDTTSIGAATVTGITEGGEYEDDVTVFTNDSETILLDGIEIPEGFIINSIGYHTLELLNGGVVEQTINFTIVPRFETEIDGMIFQDRLPLTLGNVGTITLNGYEVDNGEVLVKVGYHNMVVTGVNGYSKEYSFTLESFILERINGTEYLIPVQLDVSDFKTLYVDGVRLRGDITLREFGNYDVEITGVNGYHETYHFAVIPNFGNLIDGGVYEKFIKIDQSSGSALYIDNEEIDGVKHLSQVGNHVIRYEGLNGYVKIYNITVTEENLEIEGEEFTEFSLKYRGVTVLLNGEAYTSEAKINKVGYYTVTVIGVNGYQKDYDIFIYSETKLPNDEQITTAFNLDTKYNKVYVNGSIVPDGYRITETGDYEVVLWGEGGYTESYNFRYVNENVTIATDFTVLVAGFGVMTLLSYGFVLWRRFK